MKILENKCLCHIISREQRNLEILKGEKDKNDTMGFEDLGCYDCDGYNYKCKSYISGEEICKIGYKKMSRFQRQQIERLRE